MGVIAAKKRRSAAKSQRRKAAQDRFQEEQIRARNWISQFDQDGSNALDRDEFKKLMTYMNDNKEPTEEEVTKVFRKSDLKKTGDLDLDEVVAAVAKWKSMMNEQEFFTNLFVKFDVDQSGHIDKTELTALLTDLNESSEPPSEEEVGDIIMRVDQDSNAVLDKAELQSAVETWYIDRQLLKEEQQEKAKEENAAKNGKSGMCSIM